MRKQDPAGVMKEAETFYERASEKYGDVKLPYNETVADVANCAGNSPPMLVLVVPTPFFV